MVIIVEGIDRVGKTTLCNKIKEVTGFEIYKHDGARLDYSKMDNDNETDKMLQMLEIARIGNANIIFDRFHLSDFVYGVIERKYLLSSAIKNFKLIDNKLKEMNAVIIMMHPTDIEESSKQHGKNLQKYEALMASLAYDSVCKNVIDCNYYSIEHAARLVKSFTKETKV